jgi:hypothetical protein
MARVSVRQEILSAAADATMRNRIWFAPRYEVGQTFLAPKTRWAEALDRDATAGV